MEVKAPWLRFYCNTPAHLDYPDQSMCDLLEETAAKHPDLVACEFLGHQYRYPELVREVHRCAKALRALGVRPGDRVALWLPNTPAYPVLLFACARLGAIAVAVNTRYRAVEVADIVGRSGAKVLACAPGFRSIDFLAILADIEPQALDGLSALVTVGGEPSSIPPAIERLRRAKAPRGGKVSGSDGAVTPP